MGTIVPKARKGPQPIPRFGLRSWNVTSSAILRQWKPFAS
jgi:hypothetical protein